MGLKNGTVSLEENYTKWEKMFKKEKQKLEEIFGKIAIKIEHIGSTSIKGIKAKPIVDIAVGINDFNDIENLREKLKSLYAIKEENPDEILLIKEENNITYFLIHIMNVNSKRYNDAIIFRDYIKNNYEKMKEYEDLKIKLTKQYSNDRKMYTKLKNDFIKEILKNINISNN